ncbi:zinc ribbon domain-containing protein [bacterium]|nr:zinc ribbon domain-containing protein [bacterium]
MSYLAYLVGMTFLAWAIKPLFMKDSTWITLNTEAQELEDRKKRVYGNITDLEFDFAMGRLSQNDFDSIRKSFLSEAGIVIQKLESRKSSDLMNRIQKDTQSLNKKKSKKKQNSVCQHCGAQNMVDAKFCMKCGKELS